jgi:hypothetical protein
MKRLLTQLSVWPEDWGNRFLRKAINHSRDYTMTQLRIPHSKFPPLRKSQISWCLYDMSTTCPSRLWGIQNTTFKNTTHCSGGRINTFELVWHIKSQGHSRFLTVGRMQVHGCHLEEWPHSKLRVHTWIPSLRKAPAHICGGEISSSHIRLPYETG